MDGGGGGGRLSSNLLLRAWSARSARSEARSGRLLVISDIEDEDEQEKRTSEASPRRLEIGSHGFAPPALRFSVLLSLRSGLLARSNEDEDEQSSLRSSFPLVLPCPHLYLVPPSKG